ncbi:hypothetical protein AKJ16_DCAP05272 [Drosera capensis]
MIYLLGCIYHELNLVFLGLFLEDLTAPDLSHGLEHHRIYDREYAAEYVFTTVIFQRPYY